MSSIVGDESDVGSVIDMSIGQTSAASVYSFSSSRDGSAMLREAEGRIFNSQNELYYLPADEMEYSRLDKQHLVHLLSNDGLIHKGVVGRVRARLDVNNPSEDGSPKRVLDLGCGGGNWTISLALEYPHVEVVGVDLAPNTTRAPPPNCRFEFDDFNLGLSHYHGMFDVVHSRSAANGVINFKEFINDMGHCLKPGGILLLVEGDLTLYSPHGLPKPLACGDGDPNKSWLARMLHEAYTTMKERGSDVDCNVKFNGWLSENPVFQDEGWAKIFCPVGPWQRGRSEGETKRLQTIGELMRQNSLAFVRALKPLLLAEGYPLETVDRYIAGTDKELAEMSSQMSVQWHYAWATRASYGSSTPVPLDERMAHSTPSGGSISDPSTISADDFSFTKTNTSPQTQTQSDPRTGYPNIVATSSAMTSEHEQRMANVGYWAEGNNTSGDGDMLSDSGSENDSDELMNADSDGDTDIESVTDM